MSPECTRISRALDRHPGGVCRVDFQAPDVIDGGKPILNFPGRIYELKHTYGEQIEDAGKKHGCKLFRRPVAGALARPTPQPEATDPARPATPHARSHEVPGDDLVVGLFATPVKPRHAIYDEDAA